MTRSSESVSRMIAFLVVVCLILGTILSVSADYIGAVAEHDVFMGNGTETPAELLSENIKQYELLVQLAEKSKAQVIVFPEFGLTPADSSANNRSLLYPFAEKIPAVDGKPYNPCLEQFKYASAYPILFRMSCAAMKSKMLVLVNMIDWVDCNPATDSTCPSDNHFQYNTDVLFDESGNVVAKYHKSHEWPSFIGMYDQVPVPTEVTYQASFGVEFGLFICYDIMFEDPAKVLRQRGIQHFLYAVAQGKAGQETLIPQWSKGNQATVLSSNLGSGTHDCSSIVVNGDSLKAEKIHLSVATGYPSENILVATVSA